MQRTGWPASDPLPLKRLDGVRDAIEVFAVLVDGEGMHVDFVTGWISEYEHPGFGVVAVDGLVAPIVQEVLQLRHIRCCTAMSRSP